MHNFSHQIEHEHSEWHSLTKNKTTVNVGKKKNIKCPLFGSHKAWNLCWQKGYVFFFSVCVLCCVHLDIWFLFNVNPKNNQKQQREIHHSSLKVFCFFLRNFPAFTFQEVPFFHIWNNSTREKLQGARNFIQWLVLFNNFKSLLLCFKTTTTKQNMCIIESQRWSTEII